MKEPVELLMRVLVQGGVIVDPVDPTIIYAMAENGSICTVPYMGSPTGFIIDMSMAGFKRLADDIGRDELWLKCCALQLGNINEKRRPMPVSHTN